MYKRAVATTRISRRIKKKNRPVLCTVVPGPILYGLGPDRPDHAIIEQGGTYHRFMPCKPGTMSSKRIQQNTNTITITKQMASEMGVNEHSSIDWFVGINREKKWEIYMQRTGRVQYNQSFYSRNASNPSIKRLPLAESYVQKFNGKNYNHQPSISIPRAVFRVLMVEIPAYVRWIKTGNFYKIQPCTQDDDGAKRVSSKGYNNRHGRYRSSFMTRLTGEVADDLYSGNKTKIRWYIATDCNGLWEIHARRLKK